MANYINTQTGQYPMSETAIRAAFPNTSFPTPFVPPDEYKVVFPAPAPTFDPITEACREIAPVLTNKGNYEQQWEVYDLSPEQAQANAEAAYQASVPKVVTIRQAKLALNQTDMLDGINAAIANADRAVQIEWEYATEVRRDWPTLLALQPALGLTDVQVDDLFKLAATL
jgi:hypothetical protein